MNALIAPARSRHTGASATHLQGRARHLRGTGFMFLAGGFLLASLPPFGPFHGKSMIDDAAIRDGYGFVPAVVMLASGLAGAAVLRAGARVFLGWGDTREEPGDKADLETSPETETLHDRTPAVMAVPTALLLIGAIAAGLWFGFADLVQTAAHNFVDVSAYRAAAFGAHSHLAAATSSSPEWFDYLYGGGATLLALAFAAFGLWGQRAPGKLRVVVPALSAGMRPVRRLHTGRVGDYTAALVFGVGVLSALMTLTLR